MAMRQVQELQSAQHQLTAYRDYKEIMNARASTQEEAMTLEGEHATGPFH